MLQISITNTGRNIPEEHIDMIFEPFFQVPGTVYGTGIGLALTREMMRLHHGEVKAANLKDGVCFTLCIPVELKVPNAYAEN